MSDSERLLFRSARHGNVEAFEKLTEAYQKKIYNIIFKTCGSHNASELTQEVFVRLFKSLRHIDDSMFAICIYKTARDICNEAVGRAGGENGKKAVNGKDNRLELIS